MRYYEPKCANEDEIYRLTDNELEDLLEKLTRLQNDETVKGVYSWVADINLVKDICYELL